MVRSGTSLPENDLPTGEEHQRILDEGTSVETLGLVDAGPPEGGFARIRRVPGAGQFTTAAPGPAAGAQPPLPLLFLLADSGGGHRAAARAVAEAFEEAYPGRFVPVLCDPLSGPGSARALRWITRLYGPVIRLAPWVWGIIYHCSDSRWAMRLIRRTILTLADRPLAEAMAAHQPAIVVSFHPLTGGAVANARRPGVRPTPVVTVVTDLVTSHAAWRYDKVSRIVVPSRAASSGCHRDGIPADRCVEIGLPVGSGFWSGPLPMGQRAALRRSLGLHERRFVVVLTGGGEGSGGIARRAAAIVRELRDVDVVAICGRNSRLQRRLADLAAASDGRLTVKGFVDNMADWLRCADVAVTKAGPETIAEATCCAVPLILTSHLPGQETGNVDFVVRAGAGRSARGTRQLLSEIDQLRQDPSRLEVMRAASARLSRPHAAVDVAAFLARLADAGGF